MLVDGRMIAREIYREIKNEITHVGHVPHLTVFTCAPNFETQKFLHLKKRRANEVGIEVNVIEFPENVTTDEVVQSIKQATLLTDGIIMQLPFPAHIDVDEVWRHIPPALDVDAVHYDGTETRVLPPVVGAIAEIAQRYDVLFAAASVVVVGSGRLVGHPAALWSRKQGGQVSVVTKETVDLSTPLANAHIIISGAGQPGLITPEQIASGCIIFDAGTSEEGGELRGDADPSCAEKAALFTPVPGGIGPITIAVLLRNVIRLSSRS